jgi:Xaa-Pro aminopeptidase
LRKRLVDEGVDAFAAVAVPNVIYVTAFRGVFDTEPAHVALVSVEDAVLFTDSRYVTAFREAAEGSPWRVEVATGDVGKAAARAAKSVGFARLGLESTLPHARFLAIADQFGGEVVSAGGWIEELRTVKDADEIAAIEAAQAVTDRTFDHLVEHVLARGKSEREIALELEFFMRREGSEGVAFAPIVASGSNAALPHATPSDRELADGDLVVLDFGARVGGYCADMTRTVCMGRPNGEQRAIYEAVLSANRAGAQAVVAGRSGRDIDAAARAVIVAAGFGEHFGHGLGHGVGLEVHERPGVGSHSTSAVPLGSVITIEPGIYIPGMGGVRIEDLAVVEEGGARVLTRSAKELIEI